MKDNKKPQSNYPTFTSEIIIDEEHQIKYRKGKKLGMGGFGEVYEFIKINPQSEKYNSNEKEKLAAKIIKNSKIDDPQSQRAYIYEKNLNERLEFKYLCKCHYIFKDEFNTYFILDYMPNKTLNELNEKRHLSELEIKHYCFQLLLAIEYLHKMNIIHRDIKLSNVLLNENMEVRLCDFGLAIENGVKETKNICGTLHYIAPELYEKKIGGNKYSFETDIWAFGVVLYLLFFRKTPFKLEPKKKKEYNIQSLFENIPKDSHISKEALELIKSIFVKDPRLRPKIEKIKSSPFFNKGKGIPKFLPDYTLERAMKSEEEEQIINKAINNGECLDSDYNLPDRVVNGRKYYMNLNEIESNFDREDFSSNNDEDENDSYNNNNNINNYNKNKFNNNYNENYNYNDSDNKEINKQTNSISFANFEEYKTNSDLITPEKNNDNNDNNDSDDKINKNIITKNTPKFTNKLKNIQLKYNNNDNDSDNDNKIKEKKTDIKFNEIKINNKNNILNKEKYENNKNNNDTDIPYKKISSSPSNNIINNISYYNNSNYITINKFIDLSNKCGLGYILSNDDIGVCFNDGTKMIKIKNTNNIIYIDEKENQYLFNIKKSKIKDDNIKIKINALMLFYKEFIKNSKYKNNFNINQKNDKQNLDLFVIKWIKSHLAYFFMLSNKKIQIMFEDKSQLIFDFFGKKSLIKIKKEKILNIVLIIMILIIYNMMKWKKKLNMRKEF